MAPDGSFNVEVPANMPVELQLVDENGLALRCCGWIGTHNHFNQGCIGCHEDPELTPENLMVERVEKLRRWWWPRRSSNGGRSTSAAI